MTMEFHYNIIIDTKRPQSSTFTIYTSTRKFGLTLKKIPGQLRLWMTCCSQPSCLANEFTTTVQRFHDSNGLAQCPYILANNVKWVGNWPFNLYPDFLFQKSGSVSTQKISGSENSEFRICNFMKPHNFFFTVQSRAEARLSQ